MPRSQAAEPPTTGHEVASITYSRYGHFGFEWTKPAADRGGHLSHTRFVRTRLQGSLLGTALCTALTAALTIGLPATAEAAEPATTERVSVSSDEVEGNRGSYDPAISSDGRYVAFQSDTSFMVPGDFGSDRPDILLRDRTTGQTRAVLVSSSFSESSFDPSISGDGRYVAFVSSALDSNGITDVFVKDMVANQTERVNVSSSEAQANGSSIDASISSNGRFVAFTSYASNLVADDTNAAPDVFVRDLDSGTTTRVSVSSTGAQAVLAPNWRSESPTVSADGRYVAFESAAANLVANDTNGRPDVFVHDRTTAATTRVNVSSAGDQANGYYSVDPSISDNGRYVAFSSDASNLIVGDTNGGSDVFVHDRDAGTTTRVSVRSGGGQAGGGSFSPDISADGRYVTMMSSAPDLVADDENAKSDIFVHDRNTTMTTRINLSTSGAETDGYLQGVAISADGTTVAFASSADTLVANDTNGSHDVFVRGFDPLDADGDGVATAVDNCGSEWNATQSDFDGDAMGDRCDADADDDGWNKDREDWEGTGRLDVDSDDDSLIDTQDNCPLVSNVDQADGDGDGHGNPCDQGSRRTTGASVSTDEAYGDSVSGTPSISADGRYVAFYSHSSNLVAGDGNGAADIFVRDRQTGTTSRVNVSSSGAEANNESQQPAISADGRYVAFISSATNLVVGDDNGRQDAFVHDRQTGTTSRVSVSSAGTQANGYSQNPTISADGRHIAFWSSASNLVGDDTNARPDVFVHDREQGTTSRVSVSSEGAQADEGGFEPSVSADGRYVAFSSHARNLVGNETDYDFDIFVRDLVTNVTTRITSPGDAQQTNGGSRVPAISGDGRYVAFISDDSGLVAGDTNEQGDVFVHDRLNGTFSRVNVANDGAQANSYPLGGPSITADGRFVAFSSAASNLVGDDTNSVPDVFVRDLTSPSTSLVSESSTGEQGDGSSDAPAISADGRHIAFSSTSRNLVWTDARQGGQIYVSSFDVNDRDSDGVPNADDNCPDDPGAPALDTDDDAEGDACDLDDDNDGLQDEEEKDLGTDPTIVDTDDDGIDDSTETDGGQATDTDGDQTLDALDDDSDNDGTTDAVEGTGDADGDEIPNYRDADDNNGDLADRDSDGVPNGTDNCPGTSNRGQADLDGDGVGDACDPDRDGDAVADTEDNCPLGPNLGQGDRDSDGIGDACDRLVARLQVVRERLKGMTGSVLFTRSGANRSLKVTLKLIPLPTRTLLSIYVLEKQRNYAPSPVKRVRVRADKTAQLIQTTGVSPTLSAGDRIVITRGRDTTSAPSAPHFDDTVRLGDFKAPR